MPIYLFKCPTCGQAQDAFLHIADRDTSAPECCGSQSERQVTACMIFVPQFEAHKSVITGEVITSERQRQRMMAENRLIDANDFPPEKVFAAAKKKKAENERLGAELTAEIDALPQEVKAQVADMMVP